MITKHNILAMVGKANNKAHDDDDDLMGFGDFHKQTNKQTNGFMWDLVASTNKQMIMCIWSSPQTS
jgi:hypothetical protein